MLQEPLDLADVELADRDISNGGRVQKNIERFR